ncbi:ergothioneine biosynthesis protein EgtB [Acidisphaera sp. S103]|uniref:ergothioneine biosynthesis protein EgtB n=1 Tax=Acidisphaera sp. S103 TaxID=1747223 RepID=UPI00131CF7F4|nr:ergothioneine biosynthesis protein EgtB [Acidisphaera sp. S103]
MDDMGLYQEPSHLYDLSGRFQSVRQATEMLAAGLTEEDQCVQSMPDASPAKWHRAHTTWFFEQFVLVPHVPDYRVFDPAFGFLFNSYYEAVGPRHPRPSRGLLTRPSADQVTQYRRHVDAALVQAIPHLPTAIHDVIELGLHHEQQHLELLVTDMLHAFSANPLCPAIDPGWRDPQGHPNETIFVECPAGLHRIGYADTGFCFDNETPAHRTYLHPHAIASHLVRNRDWLDFIQDNGYRTPSLWMSDGWATVREAEWTAPLYWRCQDGAWFQFGPGGLAPLALDAPVRHISWYEADAFARWSEARLPTEAEWEAASANPAIHEITGHVWQWTESAYRPYPGYRAAPGAIGEYNGKFMINQMVLRGGSWTTPRGHTRPTYRNFFHPDKRWQFTGLRLAKDL